MTPRQLATLNALCDKLKAAKGVPPPLAAEFEAFLRTLTQTDRLAIADVLREMVEAKGRKDRT